MHSVSNLCCRPSSMTLQRAMTGFTRPSTATAPPAVQDGKVQAFTRRGADWTAKYGNIVRDAAELAQAAIIDGEMTALNADGRSDHRAFKGSPGRRAGPTAACWPAEPQWQRSSSSWNSAGGWRSGGFEGSAGGTTRTNNPIKMRHPRLSHFSASF